MKKINLLLIATVAVFAVSVTACKKKTTDPVADDPAAPSTTATLEGNITESVTLDASKTYTIKGKVYVQAPAVLTIPAGTLLKGDKASQGALIINRGAQLIANGTSTQPIIMTSSAPSGFRNRGDWGGLILLGSAHNNRGLNNTLEGISAATGENGLHGPGTAANNTQSSGSIKFVRIEFAGIPLSDDNELNSFTLGSVGSGTTIENIMVSYGNDDAYEWFGGTANAKYLIAYGTWDDDMDTDQGFSGTVQYGLIVRDPDIADKSGSRAWESSSNSVPATAPISASKFANFTVFGPTLYVNNTSTGTVSGNYRAAVEVNTGSDIRIYNSLILGFADAINGASALNINNCVFGYFPTGDAALGTGLILDSLVNIYGSAFSGRSMSPNGTLVVGSHPASNNGSLASNGVIGLSNPSITPVLAASGSYDTGAPDISAQGFTTEVYYGAFGTSANAGWFWGTNWINFDPINAAY